MTLDIIIAILLLAACIKGLRKGLIGALFALFAYIIGIVAALKLSAVVANRLGEHVSVSAKWLPLLSFLLVLIAVVLIINWSGKLLQSAMETMMLGWVNRAGGALFFTLLYALFISVALFYLVQLKLIGEETITASNLYPYLAPLGPWVTEGIGGIVPPVKDVFAQLERFFSELAVKLEQ